MILRWSSQNLDLYKWPTLIGARGGGGGGGGDDNQLFHFSKILAYPPPPPPPTHLVCYIRMAKHRLPVRSTSCHEYQTDETLIHVKTISTATPRSPSSSAGAAPSEVKFETSSEFNLPLPTLDGFATAAIATGPANSTSASNKSMVVLDRRRRSVATSPPSARFVEATGDTDENAGRDPIPHIPGVSPHKTSDGLG